MFQIISSYLIYHFLPWPELARKTCGVLCRNYLSLSDLPSPQCDVSTQKLHYFTPQISYFVCVVGGCILSFCGAIHPIGTSPSYQERKLSRPLVDKNTAAVYRQAGLRLPLWLHKMQKMIHKILFSLSLSASIVLVGPLLLNRRQQFNKKKKADRVQVGLT